MDKMEILFSIVHDEMSERYQRELVKEEESLIYDVVDILSSYNIGIVYDDTDDYEGDYDMVCGRCAKTNTVNFNGNVENVYLTVTDFDDKEC